MKKKVLTICMALAMAVITSTGGMFTGTAVAEEASEAEMITLGTEFPDFTAETTNGTFTLSEELKEKEAVLLVFWTSWCGPCQYEFPHIQQVYEQLGDKLGVVALSVEEADTMDQIREYQENLGLSFPMGRADMEIWRRTGLSAIPVPTMIDRFGRIGYMQPGSLQSYEDVYRLVSAFLGDSYTETRMLTSIPDKQPTVPNPSDQELSAALNVEGGTLVFTSDADGYDWPMLPGTIDDRSAVVPSNLQDKDTQASVSTTVTAQEGDAFVFDYNLGVFFNDYLSIVKDGETVKFISGWHDWDTWAIPLEEGEHTIDICFRKNVDPADFPPEMAATAAISDVRLLSGEDAAKALAAVPVYPVDAETSIEVLTEGARKVKGLSGGMDILTMALGCDVYDMGGNEIRIRIHADSSHDPDATLFEDTIGGVDYMLAELLNEDGTAFEYTVSFPDPEDENAIGLMLLAGQNYRESGYLQEYICGSQAAAENIVSTVGGQVGRELEPAFEDMQSESAE